MSEKFLDAHEDIEDPLEALMAALTTDNLTELNGRISVDREHLTLIFEDDGHPFDPTQRPAPDIEKLIESKKIGGLGIELVRRMSDKMSYERAGNLNRLTLHIRRLEPDDTQFITLSSLL